MRQFQSTSDSGGKFVDNSSASSVIFVMDNQKIPTAHPTARWKTGSKIQRLSFQNPTTVDGGSIRRENQLRER